VTSKGVAGVPRASLVILIGNCLATAVVARWEGQLAEAPVAEPEKADLATT
jgi:Na+/H+-dicarboxylate symporter